MTETTTARKGRKRRRSPQQRGVKRRRRLLLAAYELLAHEDVEHLSYSAIAERARIPVTSAYHFFANKSELLQGLSAHLTDEYVAEIGAPIPRQEVASWHDVVRIQTQRAIEFMNGEYARLQLFVVWNTPSEEMLARRKRQRVLGANLRRMVEDHFQVPDLPGIDDAFYRAVEIGALFLSLDYAGRGVIDELTALESARAKIGYLGQYLPTVLPRAP